MKQLPLILTVLSLCAPRGWGDQPDTPPPGVFAVHEFRGDGAKIKGTSFVIDTDYGWLLTAAHVIKRCKFNTFNDPVYVKPRFKITLSSRPIVAGPWIACRVIAAGHDFLAAPEREGNTNDWVLLQVTDQADLMYLRAFRPFVVYGGQTPRGLEERAKKPGDWRGRIYGFPESTQNLVGPPCDFVGTEELPSGLWQVSSQTSSGSSGGPFANDSELIGIVLKFAESTTGADIRYYSEILPTYNFLPALASKLTNHSMRVGNVLDFFNTATPDNDLLVTVFFNLTGLNAVEHFHVAKSLCAQPPGKLREFCFGVYAAYFIKHEWVRDRLMACLSRESKNALIRGASEAARRHKGTPEQLPDDSVALAYHISTYVLTNRGALLREGVSEAVLSELAGERSYLQAAVQKTEFPLPIPFTPEPRHGIVKVGVLHSLSGSMSKIETPLKDVLLFTFDEINRAGGVNGKMIEPVVVDAASDLRRVSENAKQLLAQDKVAAVFGCWTFASRRSALPALEAHQGLLFSSGQHQGEELSDRIFYTSETFNQLALPAVDYVLSEGKKRFYLVGTNSAVHRASNKLLRQYLSANGVPESAIEETYITIRHADDLAIGAAIKRFASAGNACVINTLGREASPFLFSQLANAGLTPKDCPVISLALSEEDFRFISAKDLVGHLAAKTYFMSLNSVENIKFVRDFQTWVKAPKVSGVNYEIGEIDSGGRVTSSAMNLSRTAVYLWKQAVESTGSFEPERVRLAVVGQKFEGPAGEVLMQDNRFLRNYTFIGEVLANGQFRLIKSTGAIGGQPFNAAVPLLRAN